MVSRRLPQLALVILAAVSALPAAEEQETRPPTALERLLQGEYLDQTFVLQAQVKMQSVRSRRTVRSTSASSPSLDLERPITVVTSEGVFYLSDYARKERMPSDVRVGLGSPDSVPSDPQAGLVQTADEVEISGEARIVLQAGELARIVGVEESPGGATVLLAGFGVDPVPVLVRTGVANQRPPAEQAAAFTASLGQLLFLLPEDADGRLARIRPEWSERVRSAIEEGRVEEGMTAEQVLLAWGAPLHAVAAPPEETTVWTFQRGSTLREQLRNRTRVYLTDGVVLQVEAE